MRSYVVLHAYFEQVQGLAPGSVVSLAGVRVGNVDKIEFMPQQNRLDVFLKIDKEYLPRVTVGSEVEIRTQGALGDKFVYIIPGAPTAPALKHDEVLPIAPATDIMSIISEKGGKAGEIFDIISDVHQITKSLAADGRLELIMSNLAVASKDFRETAKNSHVLLEQIHPDEMRSMAQAMTHMNKILGKIDQGQGTLGALVNDSSLHDSLKSLLGGQDRKKTIKTLIRSSIEKSEKQSD
jgi:phospholipid/cholesterol/gamma-HCH transport system substrate-binding protein